MLFDSIKNKLTQLQKKYTSPQVGAGIWQNLLQQKLKLSSLQERVQYAHDKVLLHELESITSRYPKPSTDLFSALENLLAHQWRQIAGSSLCYTAVPHTEVTKLMCDIALWLANNQHDFTQQERSLHRVSDTPDDYNLYKNSYIFLEKTQTQYESIRGVIQRDEQGKPKKIHVHRKELMYVDHNAKASAVVVTNMDLFKNGVEMLFPKHLEEEKLSPQQIHELITTNGGHVPPERAAIEFLMPGIATASVRDAVRIVADVERGVEEVDEQGYPDLTTVKDLSLILNTHILGSDLQHLIPLRLMTEVELKVRQEKIKKPYTGVENDGNEYFLDQYLGCSLHFLSSVPSDLTKYSESYLLIGESLFYIKPDGQSDQVIIADWAKFKGVMDKIRAESTEPVSEISLTHEEIKNHIMRNGGYVAMRYSDEYKRLINHSALTRAIIAAELEYNDLFLMGNTNLFKELKKLCEKLEMNQAGREGSEHFAGEGAYGAIIDFSNFYTRIPSAHKNRIPPDLKRQIDKLLELSSNARSNANISNEGADNVQTCIALRRGAITTAMTGHTELLTTISGAVESNAESKKGKPEIPLHEIKKAINKFEQAKKNLQTYLHQGRYVEGRDSWGLHHELMKQFPMHDLLSLPPPIKTVDALLAFFTPMSRSDRELVFVGMGEYWAKIIPNLSELRKLLRHISPAERQIIFKELRPYLGAKVQTIDDFILVESFLLPGENQEIYNTLRPRLFELVEKSYHYKAVQKYMTSGEQKEFLDLLHARHIPLWFEIVYENFIKTAKKRLLDKVISELEAVWYQYKIQVVESEIATSRKMDFPDLLMTKDGIRRRESGYQQFKRERLHNYSEQLPHLKEAWRAAFEQQIEAVSPGILMEQLFKQHSWIAKDPQSTLVEQHLSEVLHTYLLKGFIRQKDQIPECEKKFQISEKSLDECQFTWAEFDKSWLSSYTQGFPLSDLNELYLTKSLSNYPSLCDLKSTSSLEHFIGWNITRIDVLRLLGRQFPESMQAVSLEPPLVCPDIIPIELSELSSLTRSQLHHASTLLINVGTEEDCQWIALHKTQDMWTAYCPPHQNLTRVIEEIGKHIKINLCVSEYESTINDQLNDLPPLSPQAHWNVLLWGRILPACQSGEDLSCYRATVPLPILLQTTLLDCLPINNTQERLIAQTFNSRAPFTDNRLISKQSFVAKQILEPDLAKKILGYLDSKIWRIEENGRTLRIETNPVSSAELSAAFQLLMRHNITRFVFTPEIQSNAEDLCSLLDYNPYLKSIALSHSIGPKAPLFSAASRIAARNRFLDAMQTDILKYAANHVGAKKKLWQSTGSIMLDLLQKNNLALAAGSEGQSASEQARLFTARFQQFTKAWKAAGCPHDVPEQPETAVWALAQAAEMGTQGLTVLFDSLNERFAAQWNAELQKPAPQLHGFFDLNGSSVNASPAVYIADLANKIKQFGSETVRCAPLFRDLSLIIPDRYDKDCIRELMNLMNVLFERHARHPEEPKELFLFNLHYGDPGISELITLLTEAADKRDFDLVIRIPDWDNTSTKNEKEAHLKSRYRELQNKILDNQRKKQALPLKQSTKSLEDARTGVMHPEIIIRPKEAYMKQSFAGEELWYPLSTEIPGMQQQQEQEQEQEQQQEQQQEQRHKPGSEDFTALPPSVEIHRYLKKQDLLVSRDTIEHHEHCKAIWQSLGHDQADNLRQLFSRWVGSDVNASRVIETMEVQAIEKLMYYAEHFHSGVNHDNLPAGFYLARADGSSSLILCFDVDQEKRDLNARAALDPNKRNPFTVQLRDPRTVSNHQGDCRQLAPFFNKPDTLWHALATKESERADDLAPEHYLSISLESLKHWAKQGGASPELLRALFDVKSPTCLTESNLKAFGQLVYHYSSPQQKANGHGCWLAVAQHILDTFGSAGFCAWKKHCLDTSVNWTECVAPDQALAIASSCVTLKDKKLEQAIWWNLVATQKEALGWVNYAELWDAYHALLKHVEGQHLLLDAQSLERLFANTPSGNVLTFLDRLHSVLKRTANEVNSELVSQRILTHVDAIDWRHNGLYYAVCYEHYPYWDSDLALSEFKPSSDLSNASYLPKWPVAEETNQPVLHTLRFLAGRGHLSLVEFEQIKALVTRIQAPIPALRLLSACLTLGMDKAADITIQPYERLDETGQNIVSWINQQLDLDVTLNPNSFEMHWNDVTLFAELIAQLAPEMREAILQLKNPEALAFINACGRAFSCFAPDSKENMRLLLSKVQESNTLFPTILTDYPWVIAKDSYCVATDPLVMAMKGVCNEEWNKFQQQLRSIDFADSRYLPSVKILLNINHAIVHANNPAEKRRKIVHSLIENGCVIRFQEARFRPLERNEISTAMSYMSRHLELNFKSNNIHLFQVFATQHLAVETAGDPVSELNDLLRVFDRIDNKVQFNELGQVLGLLAEQAKGPPRRRYAAKQLTIWLESFIDDKTYAVRHYPINLLSILCHSSQVKTLLNNQLDDLHPQASNAPLLHSTKSIVMSKLSSACNDVLMHLALDKPMHFNNALTLLQKLHKQGLEPAYRNFSISPGKVIIYEQLRLTDLN